MLRSLAPTILKTISMNPWNGLQSNNYRTEGFEKAEYGGLALAKGREPERSSHTTLSWIRPTRPTSTVGSSTPCLSAIPSALGCREATSSFSGEEQGIVGSCRSQGHAASEPQLVGVLISSDASHQSAPCPALRVFWTFLAFASSPSLYSTIQRFSLFPSTHSRV